MQSDDDLATIRGDNDHLDLNDGLSTRHNFNDYLELCEKNINRFETAVEPIKAKNSDAKLDRLAETDFGWMSKTIDWFSIDPAHNSHRFISTHLPNSSLSGLSTKITQMYDLHRSFQQHLSDALHPYRTKPDGPLRPDALRVDQSFTPKDYQRLSELVQEMSQMAWMVHTDESVPLEEANDYVKDDLCRLSSASAQNAVMKALTIGRDILRSLDGFDKTEEEASFQEEE